MSGDGATHIATCPRTHFLPPRPSTYARPQTSPQPSTHGRPRTHLISTLPAFDGRPRIPPPNPFSMLAVRPGVALLSKRLVWGVGRKNWARRVHLGHSLLRPPSMRDTALCLPLPQFLQTLSTLRKTRQRWLTAASIPFQAPLSPYPGHRPPNLRPLPLDDSDRARPLASDSPAD